MQSLVVVDDPMPYHIMPSSKPQQLTTMPPPNNLPSKRVRKRKIIEEDEYVSILENIIERDYFPDIPKLRAQLHYLENNEKFDLNTLKSIYSTLYSESDRVFPKMKVNTSHEFDSYSVDDNISVQSGSTVDCNTMTIDSFFRKYTSEDNESFEGIQKKNSEEFRRKFHWMYENMDHLMITNVGENRHIGSSVHKSILNGQQQQVQQQKKKAGMLMLYYIGDKVLTAQDRAKMDTILDEQMFLSHNETNSSVAQRVNGAENWPFRVRNQLFFPPEIQDSYATCQVPTADSSLEANAESGGDNADGKRRSALPITHDVQNTLLITDGAATSIAVNNNTQLALLQQTKFTANYNSRAEKVIQKSNTNLPNAWHLTAAQSRHLGYSSGGSMFSDYPPLNSRDQYSTVPMSPYVGASEGGVTGTPLLTLRGLEQHNGLLHQMHSPHSQHKVSLQDLTDEQLLERYQQLSARADSSAHATRQAQGAARQSPRHQGQGQKTQYQWQ